MAAFTFTLQLLEYWRDGRPTPLDGTQDGTAMDQLENRLGAIPWRDDKLQETLMCRGNFFYLAVTAHGMSLVATMDAVVGELHNGGITACYMTEKPNEPNSQRSEGTGVRVLEPNSQRAGETVVVASTQERQEGCQPEPSLGSQETRYTGVIMNDDLVDEVVREACNLFRDNSVPFECWPSLLELAAAKLKAEVIQAIVYKQRKKEQAARDAGHSNSPHTGSP